jgi:alpha-tubulin suppressor-like RCC1 family protein
LRPLAVHAHNFSHVKLKRFMIAAGVVGFGAIAYNLLKGPPGKLKLPSGPLTPLVSIGDSHGLVLAPNGSLWSWGGQDRGWPVLGLGKKEFTLELTRIGEDANWMFISAGDDHNLALKSDGTIWAWGANYRGQLGNGYSARTSTNRAAMIQDRPVHTVPGNDWVQVEAGSVCSYAIKRDGTLWAWGLNNFGQLGVGSWTDSPTPVQVNAATNWVKVRAGGVSAAGVQSDGSLWIWGGSPVLGNTAPQNSGNLLAPTRFGNDTNWVDVAVAFNLWLGIKSDGSLWAWGRSQGAIVGFGKESPEKPIRVGIDNDWQSVWTSKSARSQLLKTRNGDYWTVDSTTPPARFRQVELAPDILTAGAGGGAIAVLTSNGEVWTLGTVLGQHGPKYRFLTFAQEICWRAGWKVRWASQPPKVVRSDPWQLRNVE